MRIWYKPLKTLPQVIKFNAYSTQYKIDLMINQDLQQKLLEAFKIEADERIESMFSSLSALEKSTDPKKRQQIIEIVYREAHSLKGAARSVNLLEIEALCQVMESVFSNLKEGKLNFSADLFDKFHDAVGVIESYLGASEKDRPGFHDKIEELTNFMSEGFEELKKTEQAKSHEFQKAVKPLSETHEAQPTTNRKTKRLPKKDPGPGSAKEEEISHIDKQHPRLTPKIQTKPLFSDTVRISVAKLDALLLKSEELIAVKQFLNLHLKQIRETGDSLRTWGKQWESLKPELGEIKRLSETHSSLNRFLQLVESNYKFINSTSNKINHLITGVEQNSRMLGAMVDDLLDEMKKTSLLPFSTLFSVLPRMVREIARDQGKEVDIKLTGGDIEIDKRILENLKDPLIHLLRNSIDHGIESPETRKAAGKPSLGKINLIISQPESNKVKIEITDDGKGIDVDIIRKKAIQKKIISNKNADKLTETELIPLIFHSGISTSPIITEISGRGLGMAIVKENIENLGGLILTKSNFGQGTTFSIELPITLATFRGILILVSGHYFIVPNVHIDHTLRILPDEIKTVENRTVMFLKGSAISLVNLSNILGLPPTTKPNDQNRKTDKFSMPAIILSSGDKRIAFVVDEILNEREVLVKNLGKQLKRVPNISGATILGSGRVVPILNVSDLLRTSANKSLSGTLIESIDKEKKKIRKSILVVEDSLTARTLLKNILEASGYMVKTAIDGEDGYNQIKSQAFDAVISDVEMPRMNGFELTKKIRNDQSLSETPVILVTNLDSRVDRERGIDAGADAYIVKSSFDRSNLLDVIERLI